MLQTRWKRRLDKLLLKCKVRRWRRWKEREEQRQTVLTNTQWTDVAICPNEQWEYAGFHCSLLLVWPHALVCDCAWKWMCHFLWHVYVSACEYLRAWMPWTQASKSGCISLWDSEETVSVSSERVTHCCEQRQQLRDWASPLLLYIFSTFFLPSMLPYPLFHLFHLHPLPLFLCHVGLTTFIHTAQSWCEQREVAGGMNCLSSGSEKGEPESV